MKKRLYMNKETGELLTFDEALKQADEWYDFSDPTNVIPFSEYYELTNLYED